MNIDKRLEALAQSLELLAAMHKDHERANEQGFAELRRLFAETGQFINSLAHVAQNHEQRLDNLENRQ